MKAKKEIKRQYVVKLEEKKNKLTGKTRYRIVGTNTILKNSDVKMMKRYFEPAPTSEIEEAAFDRGMERGMKIGLSSGYKTGTEEAWNVARALVSPKYLGGMPTKVFRDLFPEFKGTQFEVFGNYSFETVKHRMKRKKLLPK